MMSARVAHGTCDKASSAKEFVGQKKTAGVERATSSRRAPTLARATSVAQARKTLCAPRCGWSTDFFEPVKALHEGHLGWVQLVRCRIDKQVYVVKHMNKVVNGKKNNHHRIKQVYNERDSLIAAQSRWVVELIATFQDNEQVHILTEYVPGGTFKAQLSRRQRFTVPEAAFYVAELLLALDTVHRSGWVHRDVTPDNVALASNGHLKLLDFGQAKTIAELKAQTSLSQPVLGFRGTLEYLPPEFYALEVGPDGPEWDVWSVGVCTFEFLVGRQPFSLADAQESKKTIAQLIFDHEKIIPKSFQRSREQGHTNEAAEQFVCKVLRWPYLRPDIATCKREPFFAAIDWSRLHRMPAPFEPLEPVNPSVAAPWLSLCDELDTVALDYMDGELQWPNYYYTRDTEGTRSSHSSSRSSTTTPKRRSSKEQAPNPSPNRSATAATGGA